MALLVIFTNISMNVYKSLDACNYFVSSHVQDVYYHEIEKVASFASSDERSVHYVVEADTSTLVFYLT